MLGAEQALFQPCAEQPEESDCGPTAQMWLCVLSHSPLYVGGGKRMKMPASPRLNKPVQQNSQDAVCQPSIADRCKLGINSVCSVLRLCMHCDLGWSLAQSKLPASAGSCCFRYDELTTHHTSLGCPCAKAAAPRLLAAPEHTATPKHMVSLTDCLAPHSQFS
jgi:hypothetical protein